MPEQMQGLSHVRAEAKYWCASGVLSLMVQVGVVPPAAVWDCCTGSHSDRR